MGAAIKILLPGTGALTKEIKEISRAEVPALLVSKNLAGTETVTLQGTTDNGATWFNLSDENGAVALVGITRTSIPINVPVKLRLSKGVTVSAVVEVALSFGTDV